MKLTRGRARAAIVAAIVVAAVSGCAGAGVLPSPNVHRAGFGANATGTVQLWVRAATQALSQPIVNKFNATHPHLKVVLTPIPDTQYVTKFATAIRGRSVPDLSVVAAPPGLPRAMRVYAVDAGLQHGGERQLATDRPDADGTEHAALKG